uniref:Uncharacterized protein n=1 Tax=Polytomella parva TaxID=51329 RepID=A0A7S0UNY6_9CHLO|mmetsp:Transcript_12612/g.22518  ORF Transcript_12612/g.22518 Transcript_12612/m.22518 type:complete len:292 (+) Transcript_12612:268-1143(+)
MLCQKVEETNHRQWQTGKGALARDDVLYLQDLIEQERILERKTHMREQREFALLKAKAEAEFESKNRQATSVVVPSSHSKPKETNNQSHHIKQLPIPAPLIRIMPRSIVKGTDKALDLRIPKQSESTTSISAYPVDNGTLHKRARDESNGSETFKNKTLGKSFTNLNFATKDHYTASNYNSHSSNDSDQIDSDDARRSKRQNRDPIQIALPSAEDLIGDLGEKEDDVQSTGKEEEKQRNKAATRNNDKMDDDEERDFQNEEEEEQEKGKKEGISVLLAAYGDNDDEESANN